MSPSAQFVAILVALLAILLVLYVLPSGMKIVAHPIWTPGKTVLDTERDGPETSKALLDVFSLTHVSHGILLYLALKSRLDDGTAITVAMILEVLFEVVENTPFVINSFRNAGTPNYAGDSIANSVGDVIGCLAGVYVAYRSTTLGLLYVLLSELALYKSESGLVFHVQAIFAGVVSMFKKCSAKEHRLCLHRRACVFIGG